MSSDLYIIIVYFLLFLVIISMPMTIISKYVWHNKTRTQFFAFLGTLSIILLIIMVWDYIPD
jgi:hypothetical protein